MTTSLTRSEAFLALQAPEMAIGAVLEYPANSRLITERRSTRRFVAVMAGSLGVEVDGEQIAELGPGDWCGEIGLLRRLGSDDARATATVTTSSAVRVLAFDPWEFKVLLDRSRPTRALLTEQAARRLARASAIGQCQAG